MKADSTLYKANMWPKVSIILLLATAVLAVYWQVIHFDFIKFDDPRYVTENTTVMQGLTLQGIKWAFVSVYAANWHPLTWISHMLDIQFFGITPGMHHLTNVLFHLINTLMLFLVLERMTGQLWRSALVSALFALHPLHVESVAWIAERKDVLSTLFWMLTLMSYFWYTRSRNIKRYLAVILFFTLGLLSKPMLVTLPLVLLLLDFWPLREIDLFQSKSNGKSTTGISDRWTGLSKIILDKIPLLLLAAVSSTITFFAQKSFGAVASGISIPLGTRIANAANSYIAYLVDMFWPVHLAAFYPYEAIPISTVLLCLLLILLITILALAVVKNIPYFLVGWFWYLGTLFPVIGIVQVGQQSMADRYTYVPLIGIFIILVWGVSDLLNRWEYGKAGLNILSGIVLFALSWATYVQVSLWKDTESLFSHALQVTKNNDVAHLNVGYALFDKGDVNGAIKHYQEAALIRPNNPKVYLNLGEAFENRKDSKTAIEYYEKGLKLDPNNTDLHTALGTLLGSSGNTDEAIQHFQKAITINDRCIEAYNNLGNLELKTGNYDKAIEHYEKALSIDPHQAGIYNNLGTAFIYKENLKKAIENYQESVKVMPTFTEAVNNLKNASNNQKILEDLLTKSKEMLKADPQNPDLYRRIGNIYRKMGEYEDAVDQYGKALSIQPKNMNIMNDLLFVYSNNREYAKALNVLNNMKDIQPDNPEIYYNIACIYAKENMDKETLAWLKIAIEKGFSDWNLLRKDPDLANVRKTSSLQEILEKH